MNALTKLGIPVLIIGLLIFFASFAGVQNLWPGLEINTREAANHPLLLVSMYAGVLMAALGVLMIVVGAMLRKDAERRIPKRPYSRGRELRDQVPPHEQGASEQPRAAAETTAAQRPARTVSTPAKTSGHPRTDAPSPSRARGGEAPKNLDDDPLRRDDPPPSP